MIYTTLVEQYRIPKIVPIEVTVLRGARRLKLSTPLRKKYADFSPKIWHLLSKLGYQKFLQKIYVHIDVDYPLQSAYYQLPIFIAILEAIGLIRLHNPLHVLGRFSADYSLYYPECTHENDPFPRLYSCEGTNGERLASFLNKAHTAQQPFHKLVFPNSTLFPDVTFNGNSINLSKTPIAILKKIPPDTINSTEVYISHRRYPISSSLLSFIGSAPRPKKCNIDYKKCFCEQSKCICSKQDRLLHDEQLYKIRSYWDCF